MLRITTNKMERPPGICAACFNEQQRYSFPFLVYCSHGRKLALVQDRREHATFDCAPDQLKLVVNRIKSTHSGL